VAEIDIGVPRWSEDPTHVLGVLANYLALSGSAEAPDAQFRRAAAEAEAMIEEISERVALRHRLRARLVRWLFHRARKLAGLREMPKFLFVHALSRARALLRRAGEDLLAARRLEAAEDIFFLDLREARAAFGGKDVLPLVRARRASFAREARRRRIPRVLLSDGTEPTPPAAPAPPGALVGTPASPGTVTAPARVVLDPQGATIAPGEILVAPSTDPGWTPLFLTAGGVVVEMGGPMSHGAVVAREYGIPAVVGVPDATTRIRSGQTITVDGSAGSIVFDENKIGPPT
jgi:pyruvate,water dikinase